MITFLKRNLAVVIVTATVLGAGAVAWAQEAPPDPSTGDPAPPAAASPGEAGDEVRPPKPHRRGHHKPGMALAGRAIHGEVIVPNGEEGFEEITFDKGIVRKEGDGYVLERPDGVKVQVKLTDSTKFRGIEDASQIRVDEPAMVVSEKNGDARSFNQRPAGEPGEREPGEMKAPRDRRNKPADGSVAPNEEQVPAA